MQKDRRDGRLVSRGDPELCMGGRVDVARHQRVDDRGPEARLGGLHQRERGRPGEAARPQVVQHNLARPRLGGEGVEVDQGLCRVRRRHDPRRGDDGEEAQAKLEPDLGKGGGKTDSAQSTPTAKTRTFSPKLAGDSCRADAPRGDRPKASLL